MNLQIDVTSLTKSLGGVRVLSDLTISLSIGSTLLIGANGAGKSTLLRLLAGLTSPDTGAISFGNGKTPRTALGAIGFLGHKLYLYPDLTIRENLSVLARSQTSESKRLQAVERWGLTNRLDQPVRELSKGLAMRAALCRVLLQETEIVLLDEPTTALDDQGAATLIDEVDRLRKAGKILIIATHDVARLAPSAERVLLLAQGGVKADSVQTTIGTTLEQYRLVNR